MKKHSKKLAKSWWGFQKWRKSRPSIYSTVCT